MKKALVLTAVVILLAAFAACSAPIKNEAAPKNGAAAKGADVLNEGRIEETALGGDAVTAMTGMARNMFIGDLSIKLDLPGWEAELTSDKGLIWKVSEELHLEKTVRCALGEKPQEFTVSDPEGDFSNLPEGDFFGHLKDDNVTVSIVFRREGKICGYAVVAAWGRYGYTLYNARVIKAVELTALDGSEITEEQVSSLIAKTVSEKISGAGLFRTDLFVPPAEPVGEQPEDGD